MYQTLNGAIVALGFAAATLTMTAPANAQDVGVGVHVGGVGVGVGVGIGNVAFGYQDGYWDSGHRWHQWQNDEEMQNYRRAPGNKYHDWKHDRDSDKGWHS